MSDKNITLEQLEELIDIILGGLWTDGAHHKQESLQEALKLIVGQDEIDRLQSNEDTSWWPT